MDAGSGGLCNGCSFFQKTRTFLERIGKDEVSVSAPQRARGLPSLSASDVHSNEGLLVYQLRSYTGSTLMDLATWCMSRPTFPLVLKQPEVLTLAPEPSIQPTWQGPRLYFTLQVTPSFWVGAGI